MIKQKELELKNKLKIIIREVGYDNSIKQSVMDEFRLRNLNALRAAWIFSENLDLDTLTDSEEDIQFLYIFSHALNKALKEKNMDMLSDYQSYFTKVEIDQWDNYKEEEQDEIFPIVFKGVIEIIEGSYWGMRGVSNFWYWYRLNNDGSRNRKEHGYGAFYKEFE